MQNSGKEERTMTFLKPSQMDTSSLSTKTPALLMYLLNHATVGATLGMDLLIEALHEAYAEDPFTNKVLPYLMNPELPRDKTLAEQLEPLSLDSERTLLHHGLVYVPVKDNLKLCVLQRYHDAPIAGHPGQERTFELTSQDYYWPDMRRFIKNYVDSCETCARNKSIHHAYRSKLYLLPISLGLWKSVSMDFVVELPKSQTYDVIYVCINRFTKIAHFCPTMSDIDAERTAKLYANHVFKLHSLSNDIVSDRGMQFTSQFTRSLLELCNIHGN
jgi:Integrase zinc binding domain